MSAATSPEALAAVARTLVDGVHDAATWIALALEEAQEHLAEGRHVAALEAVSDLDEHAEALRRTLIEIRGLLVRAKDGGR